MIAAGLAWIFKHPGKTSIFLVSFGLAGIILQWLCHQWVRTFVPSEVVFVAFAAISVIAGSLIVSRIPLALAKASQLLGGPHAIESDSVDILFKHRVAPGLLIFAIVVGMAATYTHTQVGVPWSGLVLYLYLTIVFANFLSVGIVGGLYCISLWRLIEFSNVHTDTTPLKWHPQAIQDLSNDYLIIIGLGVLLYLLAILGVWISPGSAAFFEYAGPVRDFWITPLAACVIVYFCFIQIYLHRVAYNSKQAKIESLRERQQASFKKWDETGEKTHSDAVEFLNKLIESLSKETTWPFDLPKAATILIPVLLPATKEIAGIFEIMFKR